MSPDTQSLLAGYVDRLRALYGESLARVVLYGSYARGEERDDSDVDVLVLVDAADEDVRRLDGPLSDASFDFSLEHDVDIQPMAASVGHFRRWERAHPFYAAVSREGVSVYDAS